MRTLVVGADGTIGRALMASMLEAGEQVTGTTRRAENVGDPLRVRFDLADPVGGLSALPSADVVYLCAAMTRFADCDANPVLAETINVRRTVELGRHFLSKGSFVVFLSSNAVFSGAQSAPSESEPTDPPTTYGKQKHEAEQLLLAAASEVKSPKLAVVRLTKVLSTDFPLFAQWRTSLSAGDVIQPLSDLMLCPISLDYVVAGLRLISRSQQSGLFHFSGQKDISYADLAFSLARRWRLGEELVKPHTSTQAGMRLQWQPRHASLGMDRTTLMTGMLPQCLADVIEELAVE